MGVTNRSSDRVGLKVDGRGDRLLVTSMVHNRYWVARVDGKARPPLIVNHAFMGVRLHEGESNVELSYEPPYRLFLP